MAGVDIGGTKIAAGLVDDGGRLLARCERPTPARQGPGAVLDAAAAAVSELGAPPAAVGVGSAGVVDPGTGTVLSATDALPGWAGTDLRSGLRKRTGVDVAVVNDVHAHALGEARCGAAAGLRDVLFVTVGTGVGAAVLIGGALHSGMHAAAGHAGHVPVPAAAGRACPCGAAGHAEAAASGPAMLAEYRRRSGGAAPGLAQVSALADGGDATAAAVLAEGAAALGQAAGGAVNLIDPEAVLIGGGVSRCGPAWWTPLRSVFAEQLLPATSQTVLSPGGLGGDAALYGAAHVGREVLR